MVYDPKKHHRRSIRLKGYDYSQPGLYFITIPMTRANIPAITKKHGATIGAAMDWFKTMTTNEYIRGVKQYGWTRFDKKLWQINYYEHIIRDEQSYQRITNYIVNNPVNWSGDKFFGDGS